MPHTPPFEPDPALFPFRSRWFDSETGGRVHYVDEGEGAPILLLHGNPTWSFLWRGMIIRLRKRFRCIALDYPGFGLSEHPERYGYAPQEHADVVLELIRYLDLRRLTLVAHDWGGPIALKAALDERPRIRALVMGNTWYWPADAWHMKAFAYVMSSEPLQKLVVDRNAFVERMIPWGCKHELAPEVMDHYRGPFPTPDSREGVAALPRQITGASFWLDELAYAVPRLLGDVPLLLTWGAHDLAFPPRFMDRWREDFRRVTTRRLDAKHYFPEDAPAQAAEAIQDFLAELEAEEGAAHETDTDAADGPTERTGSASADVPDAPTDPSAPRKSAATDREPGSRSRSGSEEAASRDGPARTPATPGPEAPA